MHLSSLPDVITVNEAEPRGCVCLLVLTQRNEAPVLCNTHTHTCTTLYCTANMNSKNGRHGEELFSQ